MKLEQKHIDELAAIMRAYSIAISTNDKEDIPFRLGGYLGYLDALMNLEIVDSKTATALSYVWREVKAKSAEKSILKTEIRKLIANALKG